MRRYLEERQELIGAAAPGTTSARRLALLTDEMLSDLAEGPAAASLPRRTRWSLIALGGYGAGALLPGSDLDLLIVSNASAAELRPFVETLLYPLWDAGLSVGHQVRSRREQVRAIREDVTVLTATLTGRVIAGDTSLGADVLRVCATDAARRTDATIALLHERPRTGSPYLLEPDLKEGAGGRRDFDELTWTASLLTGAPQSDPSPLVSLEVLDQADYTRLVKAADTIAAARWEMHVAQLGSVMTEELADELLTDPSLVQRALADTHHTLLRARRRVTEPGWAAEEAPVAAADFFDLVSRGSASLAGLEETAWAGHLDHLVPGMSALMSLRRPGIAHTRTVGAHSLACAAESSEIMALATGSGSEDPVLAASTARVEDLRTLAVAALAHDVGKTEPGPGHAERGAVAVRAITARFGLSEEQAERAAALVRHHLLLATAASGIDLDDPAEIEAVAKLLGDPTLLAPLHILTVADSRATGPGAWNAWHADLVGTLVSRLDAALASGQSNGAATGSTPAHEHLEALAQKIADNRAPAGHVLEIGSGPIPGSYRVNVAAPDRHGLLVIFAGTFALAGLDILAANSAPSRSGVALDTFIVTSATLAPVGADTWNRFERMLAASLAGRLALSVRLAERRRHYAPRVSGMTEVRIEQDPRGALLHVRAPDRVGLLYDFARAVSESGLDVRSLTATSRAGWAEDTLRLEYATGTGAGALGQLAMRLREL
ncbi:MAG: HD domain-containing protein [Coriobacteriia bacterium]|nr:HD domain-containing protein [Coriobacteriia bacterium]